MKANLVRQYSSIRDVIGKNVETIKIMLRQAEELAEIAQSINSSTDPDTKNKLESQIRDINTSIGSLIDQTTELFKLYNKFAEELFG